MIFTLSLWLIICQLHGLVIGYCLYGDDPDCAFQCHCAVDSECSGGICPSGCDTSRPSGYKWAGPACQIGNVGLGKSTNMTASDFYQKTYPATGALDGIIPPVINASCAHLSNNDGLSAEWWTDLGDVYKIYNITIYARKDGRDDRLQQFTLTVYNTSDNEIVCGYHHDPVYTHITITCTRPLIGRYVHFKRKALGSEEVAVLCEVVIMGHRYIDCTQCPFGVKCNDVIGCEACYGSYQPDCKKECEPGFHGRNCEERCGNCKTNTVCDRYNGTCYDGCQIWWTDTKCNTYIELPNHKDEELTLINKTSNSIEITWENIEGISSQLSNFYGYLIQYKADPSKANYTDVGTVKYSSNSNWKFENLSINTVYRIKVIPFRRNEGIKELGKPYDILQVKTECTDPDKAAFLNYTVMPGDSGLPNITISWEMVSSIDPHCDNITNISITYKLSKSTNITTVHLLPDVNMFVIQPDDEGQYDITLAIENNEGYKSYNVIDGISVKVAQNHNKLGQSSSTLKIPVIAGALSVVIIGIIVILIVALFLSKRRKSNTSGSGTVYENAGFQPDTINTEDNVKKDGKKSYLGRKETKSSTTCHHDTHTNEAIASVIATRLSKDNKNQINIKDKPAAARTTIDQDIEENIYINSAVPVVKFESYVIKKKENEDEFADEFKTLPQPDLSRCNVSVTEENKQKNRYRSIFTYDDTRVILHDDEGSDYINASYITGYNRNKEYIATQGAKKSTGIDFWRMVWQENSNCIVMVANIEEMGRQKVYPYWPKDIGDSLKYGHLCVTTEALNKMADYTVRIMTLKRKNECRTVYQYHFSTWKDKDKPVYGIHTLLAFMTKVHSVDKFNKGPLIVHCSAGVGRTGTFIALDILQQVALNEPTLDVYGCVQRLRNERMLMVQTKTQYIYLHDALVDFIKCGNRSIDCLNFQKTFANICSPELDEPVISRVEEELEILNSLKSLASDPEKQGLRAENLNKNRNTDVVPSNLHGLYLSRGKAGNYINAVTVDSFKAHNSYVVTQMPLPHTISDFWQLVVEQGCQAIVMLNDMDSEDETCLRYWPEGLHKKEQYGRVQVEVLSVHDEEFLIVRDFMITESSLSKSFAKPHVQTVRQFQLLTWPKTSDLPPNRCHLLDLMEKLQNWQHHHNISTNEWKPLVHCFDGGSHSGMFCGASFVLERMKIEQDVNAFLAVRYVSRHRPEFLTKLHEYQFLYQMAMEYLTRHNEYANFH